MKIEWKTCFRVGVSIFLLYLCIHFLPGVTGLVSSVIGAASPLIVGCAIAYILNIVMSFYEKYYFPESKKSAVVISRRPVCLIASFVTLSAIIALVIGLIVPQLVSCVQLVIAKLPGALKTAVAALDNWEVIPENIISLLNSIEWNSKLSQLFDVLTSGIGSVMDIIIATVFSVFSGVITAFIGVIFAVYLLMGKDKLANQCNRVMNRYIKKSWHEKIMHVFTVVNDCFRRYIVGQCTEAVILGLLCTVGMMILHLPYATMIGALIAFTALIPVAGAYIGGIVGAFMVFTVSPIKAVIFIVFLVVLQQLEGNIIYPRVVGSSMGLPGIWVLAAVTVGGGILGIVGMLVGVPVAAAAYRLLREDVNKTA